MANFVFKETKQTAMKIVGILNSNDLTIKEENELVEPIEDENEDE